jgi:hypothetical protein
MNLTPVVFLAWRTGSARRQAIRSHQDVCVGGQTMTLI